MRARSGLVIVPAERRPRCELQNENWRAGQDETANTYVIEIAL